MRQIDWNNVQEATGNFDIPPVGGYVLTIVAAKEDEAKEYYKLSYDYAEGEWEGYRMALFQAHGWALPNFYRSYKNSAQKFFKQFMQVLQESNPRFDWHAWVKTGGKDAALNGLKFGAVIGEEEYQWPVGEGPVKTRQTIRAFLPIADIRAGKFEIPALKKLKPINKVQDLPPAPTAKPAATAQPSPTYDETQCPF
ncbi:MAG: hypothetical protein Q4F92_02970 [Acidaminococcus sp.]|uniref:hypothetical protein n=1 Tax=Acidaminococcus sp. TaxID=1872103 RepID=UPI0026DF630B|nr:hypothetical protein [Acidaminococcus sp.]MDO5597291.1 hypothetical protein [Acidaminococcus sp.]